jgi:hypothetical protein
MTPEQTELLREIVKVLQAPRNRNGKIETGRVGLGMHAAAQRAGLLGKLRSGGVDSIDKAAMLIQAMIGDKPVSIEDRAG